VYDSAKGEKPVVVMDIDSYEELIDEIAWDGPEDFLSDEMDSYFEPFVDIPGSSPAGTNSPATDLDDLEDYGSPLPDFDDYDADEIDPGFDPDEVNGKKKRPNWSIPSDRKKAATEVVGEDEDDPQYLEEIRY
jgi:hypothetical protein